MNMADAQEPPVAGQEPSMEEILASIRKIITDETPAPEANGATQEVVELTQVVQDDGSVVDIKNEPPPEPPPPEPPLAAEPTVDKAAHALSSLERTVEIERLASIPHTITPLGNGMRTLEDMVIELMRPLLKDWLDQNLPATVDRLVQKEIERISRKAQD
jgi:cell pole-organizing protein PopZ